MEKARENATVGVIVYSVAVLVGAVSGALALNSAATHRARVAHYLGGDTSVDRTFLLWLVPLAAALIAVGVLVWRGHVRRLDDAAALAVDEDALDALFSGPVVTYQVRRGSMSHATVVSSGIERGYRLTSQGADGSLVFERVEESAP
ncbi:MAG: hypothetical protein J0H73_13915 [Salana multivorans]|uniref:hypothetical protein n=1 Tax=Salana multivorans TaxID=120377 RepID=UPI0009675ED9|nr:hypothetical protein [Salana multivorans]MBN8883397.1 hypothetical protein [Salana multivorans]OJX94088.1 MAG: hypothetical protein BGO96_09790 [Micrococcales bacterium 73-15]